MPPVELARARRRISEASRIVGFTGAGISTESGIPDFRSPGGFWEKNRIIDYQEFVSSEEGRAEYWRQKVAHWPAVRAARPSAGHRAFVDLYRQGKLLALITQNIDGLHQRAGLPPEIVHEIHGTTTEAECLTCGDRISSDEACQRVENGERVPRCRKCDGFLKPATISFGQSMPMDVLRQAQVAAASCDILIAVGSSLQVSPANLIPAIARNCGARVVIVNRERTEMDHVADVVVRGEIGEVLPQIVGGASRVP